MSVYSEILKVLSEEGPLNARKVAEKAGTYGTVRHYLSDMRKAGHVTVFKGIRGMYEITPAGKKYLKENPH